MQFGCTPTLDDPPLTEAQANTFVQYFHSGMDPPHVKAPTAKGSTARGGHKLLPEASLAAGDKRSALLHSAALRRQFVAFKMIGRHSHLAPSRVPQAVGIGQQADFSAALEMACVVYSQTSTIEQHATDRSSMTIVKLWPGAKGTIHDQTVLHNE